MVKAPLVLLARVTYLLSQPYCIRTEESMHICSTGVVTPYFEFVLQGKRAVRIRPYFHNC